MPMKWQREIKMMRKEMKMMRKEMKMMRKEMKMIRKVMKTVSKVKIERRKSRQIRLKLLTLFVYHNTSLFVSGICSD